MFQHPYKEGEYVKGMYWSNGALYEICDVFPSTIYAETNELKNINPPISNKTQIWKR